MATRIRLEIQLHPRQAAFLDSPVRYRAFCGGRGAGKTWVGAYDMLRRSQPRRLYGVYAPTYPMLRDSTFRTFLELADSLHLLGNVNRSDMVVSLLNKSEVLFRSLVDPEKARGPNLSGAWIDEASQVPRAAYDIIIACLREAGEAGWLTATFTPKGKQHWTFDVFGDSRFDVQLFTSATWENPFISPDFVQSVRAHYTDTYARQELAGEFIELQGAVAQRGWFPIVEKDPGHGVCVRGWDLAATAKKVGADDPDYLVGTLLRRTDGRFYVCDVVRDRLGPGAVEQLIATVAQQDGRGAWVYIPQDPGAAGKLAVGAMVRALAGYVVKSGLVTGDKVSRAMPFLAQAERENVSLVRGNWNRQWLDELCAFPLGPHDDQVDSVADAFNLLVTRGPRKRVRSMRYKMRGL